MLATLSLILAPSLDLLSISAPPGANDAFSHPKNTGVWEVCAPPFPLAVTVGIGKMIDPVVDVALFAYHDHVYVSPHVPDPSRTAITFTFDEPTVVDRVRVVQHANGISELEGYVEIGGALTSIGRVFGSKGDLTGHSVYFDGEVDEFFFDNSIPSRVFRFVIRKTSLHNGYAFFRAYPVDPSGSPIPAAGAPPSIAGCPATASVTSGEVHTLSLDAGSAFAGLPYLVLGSGSGSAPGFPLGSGVLPLALPDGYFDLTLTGANAPPFTATFGSLDANGRAQAQVAVPAGLGAPLVDRVLFHSFVLIGPGGSLPLVGGAAPLVLVP